MGDSVDIRPGVSVLSVLRHLNYRPWFALAEFVDNSLQSFLENRAELAKVSGQTFVTVHIEFDSSSPAQLSIRDNAGGISAAAYERAFKAAAVPLDRTGLSEFGMGMKSAACWFAPTWSVRTKALGENVERAVDFNISEIVVGQIENLHVRSQPAALEDHYTEVKLRDLFHPLFGRTIGKVKDHLTDIYREFMRGGILKLYFNGDLLEYTEPAVLRAQYFRDLSGPELLWKKEIRFDFGSGFSVNGFAAIREVANTSRAGFALFRRGRLIQGSGDDGYRPEQIFGKSNSYRFQRVFGELHLSGFEVSHTKDGFQWDEHEHAFLDLLREYIDGDDLPILKQAEGFRVRASRANMQATAEQALESTAQSLTEGLVEAYSQIALEPLEPLRETSLEPQAAIASREIKFEFRDRTFTVSIELSGDGSQGDWLATSVVDQVAERHRKLEIRLSLSHPFMVRFGQRSAEELEGILRIAAALSIAELLARDAGVPQAGTIRRNINDLLLQSLSSP